MTYPLKIELAEEAYVSLRKTAERVGQTPEILAAQWLWEDLRRLLEDPLEPLIGVFQSRVAGWPERHDEYLGSAVFETAPQSDSYGAPHE